MVIAQMATVPERVEGLERVISSILPQVDELNIMLNGHKRTPKVCKHPKIHPYKMDNSMGDLAKFYNLENKTGYIFTIDDDLLYPSDHVERFISKIDEYDRAYPVTVHGAVKQRGQVESFYGCTLRTLKGFKLRYHWNQEVDKDVIIDTGGTGCMGWHSDTLKISYRLLKQKMKTFAKILDCSPYDLINMADIWFKWFCNEQCLDIVCIEHPGGYFQMLDYKKTIWDSHYIRETGQFNDIYQTKLWNLINTP